MEITLQKNGLIKDVATGFSWKSLFFGCLYPLCNGDTKGALIQFGLSFITFGLSWIVTPFVYNKRRIKRYIEDGYKPYDEISRSWLFRKLGYTDI